MTEDEKKLSKKIRTIANSDKEIIDIEVNKRLRDGWEISESWAELKDDKLYFWAIFEVRPVVGG